jgi:HAD superfamily hydrolase (TIGR01490 family)
MQKISVYDFCNTIVDFESGDEFIRYIESFSEMKCGISNIEIFRKLLSKIKILSVIDKLMGMSNGAYSTNKKIILWEIKGLSESEVTYYAKLYYENIVKQHLVTKIINIMAEEKRKGIKIAVVSAGYKPYIDFFAQEYNIDYLVTNEFKYNSNKIFVGKCTRPDCIGKNKVKYLNEILSQIDDEYEIVSSYGDSISDIPILKNAKCGVVVSKNKSKGWAQENNFEEIIW